jgi:hypothetical protein
MYHCVRVNVSSDESDDRVISHVTPKMAAHHYVCVDVSSAYPADGMTYYTLHRKMAAHHYVCVDVSS